MFPKMLPFLKTATPMNPKKKPKMRWIRPLQVHPLPPLKKTVKKVFGHSPVGLPSDPVASTTEENTEVITFTGRWTFVEKVVNVTYNWGNDVPSDVVSRKPADTAYNSVDAAKADMDKTFTSASTSNAPKGNIAGSWTFSGWAEKITTSPDGNTVLIALTGSWNFTPSEIKTITGVLNTLVWKEFKSQHGYSTEGTFTAIAKVMPVHPK